MKKYIVKMFVDNKFISSTYADEKEVCQAIPKELIEAGFKFIIEAK